jgi:hypothetical protein
MANLQRRWCRPLSGSCQHERLELAEDPQPEDPQLQRRAAINEIYDQADRIEALNSEWIEPEQADIEANGWLVDQ